MRRDPRVALSVHAGGDPLRAGSRSRARWSRSTGDEAAAHIDELSHALRRPAVGPGAEGAGARDPHDPARPRRPRTGPSTRWPSRRSPRGCAPARSRSSSGRATWSGRARRSRKLLEGGHLPSIILWGPAGTGQDHARAPARRRGRRASSSQLSAVSSGRRRRPQGDGAARKGGLFRTVLFVDEVHRWSKAQQDVLLPAVEEGTVTLIGATTENPYFSLNTPLLSRCLLLRLEPLEPTTLRALLRARARRTTTAGSAGWARDRRRRARAPGRRRRRRRADGAHRPRGRGPRGASGGRGRDHARASRPTPCRRRRSSTTARATRTTT